MTVRYLESIEVYLDPLETAIWHLEDKTIPAHAVPVTHPTLQYGTEYDLYERITAAELYGILRSNVIECVLLAHTSPVMGCICASEDRRYFVIDSLEHRLLLEYYLRDTLPPEEKTKEEKTNWKEEGF